MSDYITCGAGPAVSLLKIGIITRYQQRLIWQVLYFIVELAEVWPGRKVIISRMALILRTHFKTGFAEYPSTGRPL
jgi:hypothetical protein